MQSDSAKVVSFSGIDGAGKSTQIDALCHFIQGLGLNCRILTFWDDVVALPGLREHASSKAFGGDLGIGSPERPISRRDKNVTAWYITVVRMFLYLLDAMSLCKVFSRNLDSNDFIIFDRYLYDELANLPLHNWATRFFVRGLLQLIPHPDVAFVLDAQPELATLRKPEYPLDFVRRNRESYLLLSRIAGMTVVPPAPVEETSRIITEIVTKTCFREREHSANLKLDPDAAKVLNH